MSDQPLKHIICAVRGRPEGTATVKRAIALALENDAHLTFFLAIDARFHGKATPTLRPLEPLYRQLEDMGRFSMLILCDQAREHGLEKVDYVIRKGDVPTQIRKFTQETEAEIMVMGRPLPSKAHHSVFTPQSFDQFVAELERETSIQIIEVVHSNAVKDS